MVMMLLTMLITGPSMTMMLGAGVGSGVASGVGSGVASGVTSGVASGVSSGVGSSVTSAGGVLRLIITIVCATITLVGRRTPVTEIVAPMVTSVLRLMPLTSTGTPATVMVSAPISVTTPIISMGVPSVVSCALANKGRANSRIIHKTE